MSPKGFGRGARQSGGLLECLAYDGAMPVRKVKGGYRYGRRGKTYRGKGAKAKAARQGRAIKASQHRRGR